MIGAGNSLGAGPEPTPPDPPEGPEPLVPAADPDRPEPGGRAFRGDIDGLRAIAILLIVGYHVGLPLFPGGFIGVDVFFVISGFLISRNLLAETTSTGRVALLGFWGRRIRRLVPALALMIVVVLALSIPVLGPLQWQGVASDARAAALYVSNIVYAAQATNYFGEDIGSSLFLHTWSLGVEEQFYLVWPLLVAGGAAIAARRRALLRPVLIGGFGVVLVISFVLSVVLTSRGSAHAFFGLPSRAWEFAAAGLLAALPVPRIVENRRIAMASAMIGLALILGALVGFGPQTVYPGAWPLIPVAGTMLVLLAGAGAGVNPITRALATSPARALGRVSYSWYLWHWPLILLAVAAFDRDDLWVTGGAALVALAVAAVTHRVVENPVRFDRRLVASLRSTYLMGAVVTVAVLVASFGLTRHSDTELASLAADTAMPAVSLADVRASKQDFSCQEEPVDANGDPYCIDGDLTGDRTIVVVGDSHARQWKPVFSEIARSQGIRLVLRWRSVCPAIPVKVAKLDGSGPDVECQAFQRETLAIIDELEPDAVITASSDDYGLLVVEDGGNIDQARRDVLWRDAYRELVDELRSRSIPVGSIIDNPRLPADPLDCVAAKGVASCAVPTDEAQSTGRSYREGEQEVRDELGGVAVLDINPTLCDDDRCPVVIDGSYVYTDVDHLYPPFVLAQRPAVEEFLTDLLGS